MPTTGPNVRPGEKPPVLSALGRQNSPVGAVTFATYWMRTLDWGYATTSSALARTAFDAACANCAEFMKNFDLTARAGHHFVGGRLSLVSADLTSNDKRREAKYAVDIKFAAGALKIVTVAGADVSSGHAATVTYRVWMGRRENDFSVVDFRRVVYK